MNRAQCIFCDLSDKELLGENELAVAFRDKYPVTPGHTLIVTRRHIEDVIEASGDELVGIFTLLKEVRQKLKQEYGATGFTMLINYGESAGQTVEHFHLHCLPRV